MTCIVGYVSDGKVYLGGDSAAVHDGFTMPRKEDKVFKNGPFIFGFTTSFRMGNLLEFSFDPPEPENGIYDREYMCTLFVDTLRLCLLEGGCSTVENNEEMGGNFLVGVGDKLYEIDVDFHVGEYISNFRAIGQGEDCSMGALYALEKTEASMLKKSRLTPKQKVELALEASSEFSGWVCPPFTVIST